MKKILTIVLAFSTACVLASCSLFQTEEASAQPTPVQSAQSTRSSAPTIAPSPSFSPSRPVEASPGEDEDMEYKSNEITVEYYDVIEQEETEVTIDAGEETSPESAIDAVNQAIFKQFTDGSGAEANSIVFSDGNIFIDFTEGIYHLNLGSSGEVSLLDAIADAYLNNVVGAKAVFFTVEGEGYSSGHIEIPKNEAYKVKE